MTVKVSKPAINVREELADLRKPSGVAGEAMLRAETPQEQFNLINAGRRNLIINGDFQVAQRATTYTRTGDGWGVYGSVDRWAIYYNHTVVTQNSGLIDGSYKYYVSVGNTGTAPNNHFIYQKIESGSRLVSGKPITISFMAKSAHSTVLRLRCRYMDSATESGTVDSGQNTFNLTPEWKRYEWTVTSVDSSTNLTRDFLVIVDTEAVNDAVTDIYDLTDFQLELGKVATPFEHRSYGEELALCQRYYQKLSGGSYTPVGIGMNYNSGDQIWTQIDFQTEMRAAPTVSLANLIATNRISYDDQITTASATNSGVSGAFIKLNRSTNSGSSGSIEFLTVRSGYTGYLALNAEL